MAEIRFSCPHCGANLHVDEQFVGRLVKCPKCAQTSRAPAPLADQSDDSVVLAEDISPVKKPEAFAVQLTRAFIYPFKGNGIYLLIVATGVFVLLRLLANVICTIVLIELLFLLYLCAYYVSVIASSAAGDDELPEWPDLTDIWSAIIKPILLLIGNGIVAFMPMFIWLHFFAASLYTTDIASILTTAIVFVILALLYIPMGMLAIAMFNSSEALNPLVIVKAIIKIPLRYLLACGLFFLVYYGHISVTGQLARFPIIGTAVQRFFSLYMMMVAMRILGLIYYANAKKIGWFED